MSKLSAGALQFIIAFMGFFFVFKKMKKNEALHKAPEIVTPVYEGLHCVTNPHTIK